MERIRTLLIVVLLLGSVVPTRADVDAHRRDDAMLRRHMGNVEFQVDLLRRDAANDIRILNLAAHPDDEDGATLTWLRHAFGYRTHILFTTRGEGGQNEIGHELGDALGVIRSRECQAAAEGYGATISFLNALDFGFTKWAEEALQRWDRAALLQRIIDELVRFDADVVLTHHTPDEGHGHHRASSILLREACRRLQVIGHDAEPAVLLERTRSVEDADIATDSGLPAPGLPWTYAGWSFVALRRHASQGMALGEIPEGPRVKYYRIVDGVGDADAQRRWLGSADPWSAQSLGELRQRGADREMEMLLARSRRLEAGAYLEFTAPEFMRSRGYGGALELSGEGLDQVEDLRFIGPFPCAPIDHEDGQFKTVQLICRSSPTYPFERYVRDSRTAVDSLELELSTTFGRERLRIAWPPRLGPGEIEIVGEIPPATPGAELQLPLRWRGIDPPAALRTVYSEGLTASATPWKEGVGELRGHPVFSSTLSLRVQEDAADSAQLSMEMAPVIDYGPPRRLELELPILRMAIPPDLNVGFIAGSDGSLGTALTAVGVPLTYLLADDLANRDLSVYDVILVDIRAYLVREDLRVHNERLLDYAHAGGHLVVQYQKTFEWNREDGKSSWPPLPLVLGHDRVVNETAPITALATDHSFWNWPHALEQKDWDGWIQERGLYFPATWAEEFTPLLAVNDPDEEPLRGAILTAQVGKGVYTYTSLAWYRQLRVAHAGAYRAFLNLLCWPLAP